MTVPSAIRRGILERDDLLHRRQIDLQLVAVALDDADIAAPLDDGDAFLRGDRSISRSSAWQVARWSETTTRSPRQAGALIAATIAIRRTLAPRANRVIAR